MDTAVELQEVSKTLGGRAVVSDVSITIRRGEFFSLLGPSGCGKSTTLRLIAGFERPDGGRVLIKGRPTNGVPAYVRDVNMVFQNYALFPHLSVRENVGFGLEMERVPGAERRQRVDEMLRLVRLEEYGNRLPRQLSGGQQQRVALARALATRPDVVLLDEPLGALDLKLRKEMQAELKSLQASLGHTFIYVTHDQEEALALSDRMAVMHEGRVLQAGPPEEVYERPATSFVADYIGQTNLLAGRVVTAAPPGGGAVVDLAGVAVRVTATVAAVEAAEVLLSLRPERILLGDEARSAPNQCDAIVDRTIYFGTDRLVHARLPDGRAILVRLRSGSGAAPAAGERVLLGWAHDAASIVQAG